MHIEQLQAFVEIASSKSINVAAENLYIAQPSLSRSMKLLEENGSAILRLKQKWLIRYTKNN